MPQSFRCLSLYTDMFAVELERQDSWIQTRKMLRKTKQREFDMNYAVLEHCSSARIVFFLVQRQMLLLTCYRNPQNTADDKHKISKTIQF